MSPPGSRGASPSPGTSRCTFLIKLFLKCISLFVLLSNIILHLIWFNDYSCALSAIDLFVYLICFPLLTLWVSEGLTQA